jgi:hypothetical protein
MPANPFGSRLHYNVGAEINRPAQVACATKGVVYDQGQVVLFGNGSNFFKIRNRKCRIADRLYINGFRFRINFCVKTFRLVQVDKSCFYPKAFEANLKLVIGASILIRRSNKIIAGQQDGMQSNKLR